MLSKPPYVIGSRHYATGPDSKRRRVVMLNNAATTPPFRSTLKVLTEFFNTYGALHRGAGPHATKTVEYAERAMGQISRFIGLPKTHTILFTQNTSSAINLFIRLLDLKQGDIILTSELEHTSNNLPWLYNTQATTVYVKALDDGALDYEDLEKKVKQYSGRLRLVAITGASNLSGYVPDIKRIAALVHAHNALLFVDAAQLAPHRPINMQSQHIDALAFSAHKVYAPFGIGVLALPAKILERMPVDPGGGSIDMISDRGVLWAPPLVRHQTGTWNVPGIVALGTSLQTVMDYGWENIMRHESELVAYAAERLATVPKLKLYIAPEQYVTENRIGTFAFNLNNYHHALLAAILEHEYGIETRAGTICNHRLVRRWAHVGQVEQGRIEREMRKGNRLASYGIVRASLGIHNTKSDIDTLVKALTTISRYGIRYSYRRVPEEETYILD